MKKFQTKFVAMNPSHCVACWKCMVQCPKNVIGKVGFLWHQHAAFQNAEACIGCKKCIKTCPHEVFFVPDADFKVPSLWNRIKSKASVEVFLPLFMLATIVTGIKLHVAGHGANQGAGHGWLMVHVATTVIFAVSTIWHIVKRKKDANGTA